MFPESSYFPVNWQDGTNVSSKDFLAEQNAIQDALRDTRAAFVNDYNYGLLNCDENPEPHHYPQFILKSAGENINIFLKECRAITSGGYRIEWTERMVRKLNIPESKRPNGTIKNKDGEYYIIVTVDPYKSIEEKPLAQWIQVGPDSQSGQPRKLNTIPLYDIHIVPTGELNYGPNRLAIGKLVIEENNPSIDETGFIPACTTINSHAELQKIYEEELVNRVDEILSNCIKILRQTKVEKNNPQKPHALNAYIIAEKLAFYIESNYTQFKLLAPLHPPIFVISQCLNLAKTLQLSFRILQNEEKFFEKFLTGCVDNGFDMEQILNSLLNNTKAPLRADVQHSDIALVPRHANIKPSLDLLISFLEILKSFTDRLVKAEFQEEGIVAW